MGQYSCLRINHILLLNSVTHFKIQNYTLNKKNKNFTLYILFHPKRDLQRFFSLLFYTKYMILLQPVLLSSTFQEN